MISRNTLSLRRIFAGVVFASCAAAFSGELYFQSWLLVLNSNFTAYYAPLQLLGLLSFFWWGKAFPRFLRMMMLCAMLGALLRFGVLTWPFYAPAGSPNYSQNLQWSEPIRVSAVNVFSENSRIPEAGAALRALDSDVLALFEVNRPNLEKMSLSFPEHYFVEQIVGFGIALYSKIPLIAPPRTSLGDDLRPVMLAELDLGAERKLVLPVFDALPPLDDESVELNRRLMRRMGVLLRHEIPQALVLTDLNATPYSLGYRGFLKEGRLSDVWWGRGLERSWDLFSAFKRFRIDHALVKGNLRIESAEMFELPGSDHLGITISLRVASAPSENQRILAPTNE